MTDSKTEVELPSPETIKSLKALITEQEKSLLNTGFVIHDDALQLLTIFRLKIVGLIENLELDGQKQLVLKEAMEIYREIYDNLTLKANHLYPPTVKFAGLSTSFLSICRNVMKEFSIGIEITDSLPIGVPLFTLDDSYRIYYLFKDVLTLMISNSNSLGFKANFSIIGRIFFIDLKASPDQNQLNTSHKNDSYVNLLSVIRGRLLCINGFVGADTDWKKTIKIGIPISDSKNLLERH